MTTQTSKLALIRFTEYLSSEYADKGIIAHSVHPGAIPTSFNDKLPKELHPYLVDTVEVAAHTILWLVKERRTWLAGRFISCQWDVEALLAKKQEIVDGDKLKIRMVV